MNVLVEKRFTSDEVHALVGRAEQLLGRSLVKLLERHAVAGSRPRRHRLIELLLRMRQAAQDPDGIWGGVAAVNAPELHAFLDLYDEWHESRAWPELQRMLCSPAEFLHTVSTLAIANLLRTRHPNTGLAISEGSEKHPDLMLLVTDQHDLAVEVKAPQSLWQLDRALPLDEAMRIIRLQLRESRGQLSPDRPGLLAIAGLHMSADTFEILTHAGNLVFENLDPPRPYLLGVVLHNLNVRAGMESAGLASIWLEQRSRIGRNKNYSGPIQLVGDWSGPWQLATREDQ
jgi:hypothetical protein